MDTILARGEPRTKGMSGKKGIFITLFNPNSISWGGGNGKIGNAKETLVSMFAQ